MLRYAKHIFVTNPTVYCRIFGLLLILLVSLSRMQNVRAADRPLLPGKGFGQMFHDLREFRNPKENLFNRWLGSDTTRFFVTFPEGTEVAGVKTYAGFWAHKMKRQDEAPFFIDGDYEFLYYKFTGISPLGERMTYNLYRLRINAQTLLSNRWQAFLLFRDLEGQQSNFDMNYVRGTVALGATLWVVRSRHVGFLFNAYSGVAVQGNFINERIPGIQEGESAPHGASSTSGVEFKFTWRRILGHFKVQFSIFNPDSIFNRYTVRMSIRNIVFNGDYIWIQLDSDLPVLGSSYQSNMLFFSYYRRF